MTIDEVLQTTNADGYVRHRLAKGAQPGREGWEAACGRTIFRSRALMPHPLLPARRCPECYTEDEA